MVRGRNTAVRGTRRGNRRREAELELARVAGVPRTEESTRRTRRAAVGIATLVFAVATDPSECAAERGELFTLQRGALRAELRGGLSFGRSRLDVPSLNVLTKNLVPHGTPSLRRPSGALSREREGVSGERGSGARGVEPPPRSVLRESRRIGVRQSVGGSGSVLRDSSDREIRSTVDLARTPAGWLSGRAEARGLSLRPDRSSRHLSESHATHAFPRSRVPASRSALALRSTGTGLDLV